MPGAPPCRVPGNMPGPGPMRKGGTHGMPMTQCDVLISGGGPAGAAAARVLARAGVDVLLLERARFPRPKLCGGLLPEKAMRLAERLYGAGPDELLRAGALEARRHGYLVQYRGVALARGEMPYPFHLARREDFDLWCLGRAEEAGATVRQGQAVSGCDPGTGAVRTTAGETMSARVVIGADGATSPVRKSLPPDKSDRAAWRAGLASGLEIFLPYERFPERPERITLHLGVVGWGYAWVFPRRGDVGVGVCGLYTKNRRGFKALLTDYLDLLGVRGTVADLHSHPLPYGNYLSCPAHGRVLLAGDAAGFIEPLLGEGVYYAMRTGELAARAALAHLESGADPARAYLDLLGPVHAEMRWSLRLRRLLFGLEPVLGSLGYRVFVGLFEGRILDAVMGRRSFRLFARRDPRDVYL